MHYECEVKGCHARLLSKQSLREHQRVHTSELPYQCRVAGCEARFKWRSSEAYHVKKVHGKASMGGRSPSMKAEEHVETRSHNCNRELPPVGGVPLLELDKTLIALPFEDEPELGEREYESFDEHVLDAKSPTTTLPPRRSLPGSPSDLLLRAPCASTVPGHDPCIHGRFVSKRSEDPELQELIWETIGMAARLASH